MTTVNSELQQKVYHSIDQVKDILFRATDRIQTTTQQVKDTLTEKIDIQNAITQSAANKAISSSTSNWLQDHPAILHLVQTLIWATEHPVISLIVLLFAVAIAWSLIKSIGRLIDKIATAVLQTPLKLLQGVFIVVVHTLGNLANIVLNRLPRHPIPEQLTLSQNTQIIKDKSQQIAEISHRLEAIQKEQNELLKALMEILVRDEKNITLS
ncbi:hypothetical protein IQ230_24400 [Gloeocapsopsis crepidinum LEGE 06123]|uniref:Uncharacterized protein n=1 Tax=Gloeocapsopsis crepidinum LEGE 06123 TaxID=588587 RepID=A0ABR9UZL1_9CHRO|nr:hypothetical protein [Gloeocapsopsis crepidinum]MBE9193423.1 hypothetical protein [Gloeocapsopsis crepidinum LEGE 06123]